MSLDPLGVYNILEMASIINIHRLDQMRATPRSAVDGRITIAGIFTSAGNFTVIRACADVLMRVRASADTLPVHYYSNGCLLG